MGLLGRREHSALELRTKLRARGYAPDVVAATLETMVAEGWQSDERFTEQFVRSRGERGKGPFRISAELRERGIDDALGDAYLDSNAAHWTVRAREVRERRFGEQPPATVDERARQSRFLTSRGFTGAQVRAAFEAAMDDEAQAPDS